VHKLAPKFNKKIAKKEKLCYQAFTLEDYIDSSSL